MIEQNEVENSKKWLAPFLTIWSGQAISLLGSQMVQFSLIWWLTQKTGSATVLATAMLVGMLPQVFLGPVAGALVDRWNRRLVMIAADSLIALATLGLAALFWSEMVQVWHIYLLMFFRSCAGIFHWGAMQASTSLMAPKQHLSRIQGLNQILQGAMNIGSAPLGALLLAVLPMQGILGIDVVTALIAVLPLLFIPIPQPERSAGPAGEAQQKASVWQDLRAGFRYVWSWPGLLIIMLMAALINFVLTPTSAILPILVTEHFKGQALQLAWVEAAWGLGVVVGGLLLSVWGGFRRRVLTSFTFLFVLGVSMTLIGFTPASAFWLMVLLFFITGITNPLINGPLLAVIQAVVAPDMQGRVFTLLISIAGAMTPLSLLVAGPISDRYGVQTWFVVGGLATLVISAVTIFAPAVRNIEQDRPGEHQESQPAGPAGASVVDNRGD